MRHGLRLMIFDRSCTSWPWLTQSWKAGSAIARARAQLDASFGAADWAEALDWLATYGGGMPIAEIQFWGHGKWGKAFIDKDVLDLAALREQHPLRAKLEAVRARTDAHSRWWFRTCETFGAQPGHDFARAWTDFFGCDAAGHTFIIGPWQSGLHNLRPGQEPSWSLDEGLAEGTPQHPTRAFWSRAWRPRTIVCLRTRIPEPLLRLH